MVAHNLVTVLALVASVLLDFHCLAAFVMVFGPPLSPAYFIWGYTIPFYAFSVTESI